MVTVGQGLLQGEAFAFYDAVRSYQADAAVPLLHDDATFTSPWSKGTLRGRQAIGDHLTAWLTDPEHRPSFAMRDVTGSARQVCLKLTVSGRFGRWPRSMEMWLLVLQGKIHQVDLRPAA